MIENARQAFQLGRHGDAERLCHQILSVDARHADSLHLLGMIAFQTGRYQIAAERISFNETKIDQYRMELYGGKANILANDFQSWFDALWHGRELAYTLAVLAIVIGLACFLLAEHLPKIPAFPPADHDRRAKPGESAGLTPQPPADSNSAAKPNSKTP